MPLPHQLVRQRLALQRREADSSPVTAKAVPDQPAALAAFQSLSAVGGCSQMGRYRGPVGMGFPESFHSWTRLCTICLTEF